jgi:hypothetical protein
MSFSYNEAVEGQSRSFGYTYEKSSGEVEKILYFTNKSENYSVKEEDRIEENPLILGKETRFGILPSSEVLANFKREVLYICGKSGSGKSYQIAKFVEMYHKFYPQNKIVWISAKNILDDVSLKNIINLAHNPLHPPVGPNKVVQQVDLLTINSVLDFEGMENMLFVFDDIIDSPITVDPKMVMAMMPPGKEVGLKEIKAAESYITSKMKSVKKMIADSIIKLLNVGRDKRLSCIVVDHKINSGTFSKKVVLESTAVMLFPYNNVSKPALRSFLEDKLSYSKEESERVANTEFFEFDYLYLNTGIRFFMTPRHLEIL